jgi:hypothetical protein
MLKVKDVAERIGLDIKVNGNVEAVVTGCYISDLLSDVMANSKVGELWITLQIHPNIVVVASIKGLSGIIIPNGRKPDPETVKKAEIENITIMTTTSTTFKTGGLIYKLLE